MRSLTTLRQLVTGRRRLARIERELERQGALLEKLVRIGESTENATGSRGAASRTLLAIEGGVQALVRDAFVDSTLAEPGARAALRRFGLLSQNAEDGITLALLEQAGVGPRRFLEIGSGGNGGTCGFLAAELGWTGAFVDASEAAVREARLRFSAARVNVVQARVDRENVDVVAGSTGLGGEVAVLGLDIDGNDYWVWEALTSVSPRVVVLEYNAAFGPDASVTIPYDSGFEYPRGTSYFGASLSALARLSARKGYRLVATEPRGANAFFVREDLALTLPTLTPAEAFRPLTSQPFVLGHEPTERTTTRFSSLGAELEAVLLERGLELVEVDP